MYDTYWTEKATPKRAQSKTRRSISLRVNWTVMELLLLNLIFILAKTRASIKLARFDKTLCKSPDEMYSHQYDVLYAFTQVWKKNNFIRHKSKLLIMYLFVHCQRWLPHMML